MPPGNSPAHFPKGILARSRLHSHSLARQTPRANPVITRAAPRFIGTAFYTDRTMSTHSAAVSHARSEALQKRAERYFPGGVNSPVRAFRAVGGAPPFIEN